MAIPGDDIVRRANGESVKKSSYDSDSEDDFEGDSDCSSDCEFVDDSEDEADHLRTQAPQDDAERPRPLAAVLAQLRGLEHLELQLTGNDLPYAGELAAGPSAGLTRLQSLGVHFFYDYDDFGPSLEALVVDLLRGAAASLRRVDLGNSVLSPTVVEALQDCAHLCNLTLNVVNAADVLRQQPLRSLGLHVLDEFVEGVDDREVTRWLHLLKNSHVLAGLRELHVIEARAWVEDDQDDQSCRTLDVLQAVLRAAGNLEVLVLDKINVHSAFYEGLLVCLPSSIRSLHLGRRFPATLVARLVSLPGLREVAGSVLASWGDGEEQQSVAAIEAFARLRPDVSVAELKSFTRERRIQDEKWRKEREEREARERSPKWYAWWEWDQ